MTASTAVHLAPSFSYVHRSLLWARPALGYGGLFDRIYIPRFPNRCWFRPEHLTEISRGRSPSPKRRGPI